MSTIINKLMLAIDRKKGNRIFPVDHCEVKIKGVDTILNGLKVVKEDDDDIKKKEKSTTPKKAKENEKNEEEEDSSCRFSELVSLLPKNILSPEEIINIEIQYKNNINDIESAAMKLYLLKAYGCKIGITEISEWKDTQHEDEELLDNNVIILKVPGWTNQTWEYIQPALLSSSSSSIVKRLKYHYEFKELHLFGLTDKLMTSKKLTLLFVMLQNIYKHVQSWS